MRRAAGGAVTLDGFFALGRHDAAQLQDRFAARMEDVEGGPLELKQTVESIHLCAVQQAVRKGMPLQ